MLLKCYKNVIKIKLKNSDLYPNFDQLLMEMWQTPVPMKMITGIWMSLNSVCHWDLVGFRSMCGESCVDCNHVSDWESNYFNVFILILLELFDDIKW